MGAIKQLGKCGWLDFVGADFWELCWMKKRAGYGRFISVYPDLPVPHIFGTNLPVANI